MGRGRGGARGGGRGGRGGKAGRVNDAASSEDPYESKPAAKGKKGRAAAVDVDSEAAAVSGSMKRAQRHEDMYDEVDDFMANRHKIGLRGFGGDDDDDDDDDGADGIGGPEGTSYELEGLEPDGDEAEEDDEEDGPADYDQIEAAEEEAARKRAITEEENISKAWGKKKSTYYTSDTADFELMDDEEDAVADEEAEGKRLQLEQMKQIEDDVDEVDDMLAMVAAEEEQQKSSKEAVTAGSKKKKVKADSTDAELLKAMDDDLDNIGMTFDFDMDMDLPVEDEKKSGKSKKKATSAQSVLVEKITKDVSQLSESAKLEQLLTSSPELLSLIDDFKNHMAELNHLMPQYEEMKENTEDVNQALYCYLSLKVESLLMYCCHVSFYLSLKADGTRNTQKHPIMKTMLQLRQTLQKLGSLEEYFANMEDDEEEEGEEPEGEEGEEDEQLADEGEDDDEDGEDEDDLDMGEDDEAMLDGGDDDDDFDLPAVDPDNLAGSDLMSRQASQLDRLLAGVNAAKKKKSKLPAGSGTAKLASDYGEVDHRAEMARNITIGAASGKLAALQARVSQSAADMKAAARKKRPAAEDEEDDRDDEAGGWAQGKPKKKAKIEQAAEIYEEVKTKKQKAKEAKKALYTRGPVSAGPAALGDADHRKVSRQIESNRGLVRSRDKQRKTPKTRNRARWDKKKVARAGAVQEFKGSQAANYGGQATGIKTNLTKSISLR